MRDTCGRELKGIFRGYIWSPDDSCRVETMLLLKANILGMSFSIFMLSFFFFFLVSAENLKKSLNRTKGQILNVQCNILYFAADADGSDKFVLKKMTISFCFWEEKHFKVDVSYGGRDSQVWRGREQESPSYRKSHFCCSMDHGLFLHSFGGTWQCCRESLSF